MKNERLHITLLAAAFSTAFAVSGCVSNEPASDVQSSVTCPTDLKGNECEYYKDGYRAGVQDGKMGMSMAYQRHEGYDSRFEPYFARGYQAGWMISR